ncbi:MAG: hypothetical protein QM778_32035 [Myxococcales bacterium]
MARRAALPVAIFLVCACVYVLFLGEAPLSPSPNNHYVHLARSFLNGQLSVVGNRPPGNNDWALYNGTWYVTFPPVPALVLLPAVAIWDLATPDRLIWAILAGVAPALLFVLLERLSRRGDSPRGRRENLVLTGLFAFGTVFFYTSVQGSVWFSAHVVASVLLLLFVLASLDAAHPLLAGLCLGLAWGCRPTTLLAGSFFVVELLRAHQRAGHAPTEIGSNAADSDVPHPLTRAMRWVLATDFKAALPRLVLFALPMAALFGLYLWFNAARFGDPFVFGHEYLQIRWKGRIDRWGLFHYHYFSKNLAVFLASLPWLSDTPPYVTISRHGLALWFTTPALLWLLWPKRVDARMVGLILAVAAVGLANLCYQNSGWVQFGYRFALDYMAFMFVLLALGARRFRVGFYACLVFAVAVNAFGAATFDRSQRFYDDDRTQNRVFQPD